MKHSYTEKEQFLILELRADGKKWKEIAAQMGLTVAQVSSMWWQLVNVRKGRAKRPIVFTSEGKPKAKKTKVWDFKDENV